MVGAVSYLINVVCEPVYHLSICGRRSSAAVIQCFKDNAVYVTNIRWVFISFVSYVSH